MEQGFDNDDEDALKINLVDKLFDLLLNFMLFPFPCYFLFFIFFNELVICFRWRIHSRELPDSTDQGEQI